MANLFSPTKINNKNYSVKTIKYTKKFIKYYCSKKGIFPEKFPLEHMKILCDNIEYGWDKMYGSFWNIYEESPDFENIKQSAPWFYLFLQELDESLTLIKLIESQSDPDLNIPIL
jgi:hypothetical protein